MTSHLNCGPFRASWLVKLSEEHTVSTQPLTSFKYILVHGGQDMNNYALY